MRTHSVNVLNGESDFRHRSAISVFRIINHRLRNRWLTVLSIAIVLIALSATARAQDRVVLQLKDSSSRIALRCSIIEYTGEQITVRMRPNAPEKSYPAEQVVEIQTYYNKDHQRGLNELKSFQTADAVKSLEKAMRSEPRSWVRRDILALLVRAALRQGDYTAAGSRFLLLIKSDATTRHFKLIPLIWAAEELNEDEKSSARVWLDGTETAAQLIGASLLMNDRQQGKSAEAKLKQLKTTHDHRVRDLARIQLWRLKLRASEISRIQLDLWERDIQRISDDIRGGPYFLLGRGYQIRQEFDQAAASFLWVALVFDHDHRLAARACVEAAASLRRIGQTKQALTLYREVALRYRETEFAREIQDDPNPPAKPAAIDSKR